MGDVQHSPPPPRPSPPQKVYITDGGLRMIFDLDGRPFKFRNGETVVQADGPLVVMNGGAAGWVGMYPPAEGGGTDWRHGREGAGVSIVLDVVPTQDLGSARTGESLGNLAHIAVANWFVFGAA
jgi:hypothetical protein